MSGLALYISYSLPLIPDVCGVMFERELMTHCINKLHHLKRHMYVECMDMYGVFGSGLL